jgi:membrane-bound serine protease (ClpP class)
MQRVVRGRATFEWVLRLTVSSALVCALWGGAASRASAENAAAADTFWQLRLTGVINPPKARWIASVIERAQRERPRFVLISIDTPGGLVVSMQEICGTITNSAVPVVGYVEPRGAQATSAGAFILLATDVAAMAPGTRVGAAHPVSSGQKLDAVLDEKATNSLASLARSLAQRRARPPDLAESMVRQSRSFTEDEALRAGGIEIVAADASKLVERLDGWKIAGGGGRTLASAGASRVELTLPWHYRVLDVLADPTLAALLLSLGVMAVLYEFSAPGIGMGGLVGVICIVLGLLGSSVLPLDLGGALLLLVGLSAIAVEIKAQTHGMLAAGGIVALVLGAMALVDPDQYFGVVQRVDWRVFAPTVTVLVAVLVAVARAARRALAAAPELGLEAMIHRRGRAKVEFAPSPDGFSGSVFVDGARWQAVSSTAIAAGDAVEVEAVLFAPTRLRVKKPGTHG